MAVPPRSYNPSSNITDMVNDAPPPTYFPRSYVLEMENNVPPTPPPSYCSRSNSMNSAPPPAYHPRPLHQQRVSVLQRSHTRRPPDASKRKAKQSWHATSCAKAPLGELCYDASASHLAVSTHPVEPSFGKTCANSPIQARPPQSTSALPPPYTSHAYGAATYSLETRVPSRPRAGRVAHLDNALAQMGRSNTTPVSNLPLHRLEIFERLESVSTLRTESRNRTRQPGNWCTVLTAVILFAIPIVVVIYVVLKAAKGEAGDIAL
jgi:hypothetical protein